MRLVIFDIDGTLTQTMKADEECFVRSLAEVCGFAEVNSDWSRYKHATDFGVFREIHEVRTGRLPSPSETSRFSSTLLLCLPGLHPKLLLQQSQEHLCCFRAWMGASSIASPLLLGLGVTRLVLRWRVLACPMTIIQRHRATMRLIESPLSGCRCRGQPSDLAGLAAPFTLETGCGMLAHVAALVFRSLVLAQGVAQHGCRQRELFASFQISVTRSYF